MRVKAVALPLCCSMIATEKSILFFLVSYGRQFKPIHRELEQDTCPRQLEIDPEHFCKEFKLICHRQFKSGVNLNLVRSYVEVLVKILTQTHASFQKLLECSRNF